MLKSILFTLLFLGVIGAAGAAWAKHRSYCSADGRIQHITQRVGSKLDLDADQLDRLEVFAETLQEIRNERAVVDAFADFSDSLEPEQRSRLAELIGDRMMHHWGHPRWGH